MKNRVISKKIITVLLLAVFCAAGCGKSTDTGTVESGKIIVGSATPKPEASEGTTMAPADPTAKPAESSADTPAPITSDPGTEPTEEPTPEPTVTPVPTRTIDPNAKPFTISFVGDVLMSYGLCNNYAKGGILGVVSQKVLDKMTSADFMVANHEYCCTDIDKSNAVKYQTYIEHATTDKEHIFAELGIDVAGFANNHGYDYGPQGFLDTLDILTKYNIPYVGAGRNSDESNKPVIIEKYGIKIAIFAANGVITHRDWISGPDKPGMNSLWDLPQYDSYAKTIENIKKASEECDLVIGMPHFGDEMHFDMNAVQKQYAHAWVDAGCDIIIGSHPHVLQGMEYYNNGIIFYSLGNFLFEGHRRETCIVTITYDPRSLSYDISVMPCLAHNYRTDDVSDNSVFDLMNKHSINAKIEPDGKLVRTK